MQYFFVPSQLFFVVLSLWAALLGGQVDEVERHRREAEALITASLNDSALAVLSRVYDTLPPQEQLYGHSGLMIRLTRTQALRRKREYVEATRELLELIDDSEHAKEYYIQAAASIRMAIIYMRQNAPEEALLYLRRARRLVDNHGITSLEPNLFNREASYERSYGDPASASRLAWQALIAAEELQDERQIGLAHFNLSLLTRNEDIEISKGHLEQAAKFYHNTGSTDDYLVMTMVLSELYYDSGRFDQALEANDSAMVYVGQSLDKDSTFTSRVYKLRANLMREKGQQDSAWHYLNLAHLASVDYLKEMATHRAAEVEAGYRSEKKSLLIAHQNRLLLFNGRREEWIIVTLGIVLLAITILYYYYTRLNKVHKLLGVQAETIRERNDALAVALDEQRMLQGEVHHRVKNNLQIIISLLELQMDEMPDPVGREALSSMAGRIYSMAAVHETLYHEGQFGRIEFGKYVRKICNYFCEISSSPLGCQHTYAFPECWLNLETVIPLGTILNELLTNTYKYGIVPDRPLSISISLDTTSELWCLEYRDNGPGYPLEALEEREGGLGTYLLLGMSKQLQGFIRSYNDGGAVTQIFFRLKNDLRESTWSHDKKLNIEALN